MLMTRNNGVFWACDACRRPGAAGKDLMLVWRKGEADSACPCYTIHKACVQDLVKTVLLTDDDLEAVWMGPVTLHMIEVSDWDCYIHFGAAGRVHTMTLPQITAAALLGGTKAETGPKARRQGGTKSVSFRQACVTRSARSITPPS